MTNSIEPPPPAARGTFFRERGTRRLVIIAVALAAAWYAYSTVRTNQMRQVKWPTLQPLPNGLTVLGLNPKQFIAIEANHAWQFRTPDDATDAGDDESQKPEEADDRGRVASVDNRSAGGRLVTLDEVMRRSPVVLTGAHFTSASIDPRTDPFMERKYFVVHVGLTDEGRSRYWQYSREHEQERLVFALQGEAMTCPKMVHMDVSSLSIDPIWVKADAEKLADVINTGAKKASP